MDYKTEIVKYYLNKNFNITDNDKDRIKTGDFYKKINYIYKDIFNTHDVIRIMTNDLQKTYKTVRGFRYYINIKEKTEDEKKEIENVEIIKPIIKTKIDILKDFIKENYIFEQKRKNEKTLNSIPRIDVLKYCNENIPNQKYSQCHVTKIMIELGYGLNQCKYINCYYDIIKKQI